MLTLYRRHLKRCEHREEGRKYRRCRCPVWVDGHLKGIEIHKTLDTCDWQNAQGIVRDWEATGQFTSEPREAEPVTLDLAWQRFLADLESRKLHASTVRKYRLVSRLMKEFAVRRGLRFPRQFDVAILGEFRSEWRDGPLSSAKKLERLRAFFRFAQESKLVDENPARKLKAPKVAHRPTMPFTHEEMLRILGAFDQYVEQAAPNGKENARRLRALILLLRYSGLRISDVVNLCIDRVTDNRLFLYTQKTGVPVQTVLPDFVLRVLEATPRASERYFFWSGSGNLESAVRSWQTRLRRFFKVATIPNGHAHRFRDTFGVALLLAGIPIDRVSILLGHQSVKVTEKHYNPWVRARQEQLEADLESAWSRDPIVLLETKGTQGVRGRAAPVN